jgi:hypothetical protein
LDDFTPVNAEPSIEQLFGGIIIDQMDESETARDSIRVNRKCDSNEIDGSDSQREKHDEPRLSTPRGITMIEWMNMKMYGIQFVIIVNSLRMKSNGIPHTVRNIPR